MSDTSEQNPSAIRFNGIWHQMLTNLNRFSIGQIMITWSKAAASCVLIGWLLHVNYDLIQHLSVNLMSSYNELFSILMIFCGTDNESNADACLVWSYVWCKSMKINQSTHNYTIWMHQTNHSQNIIQWIWTCLVTKHR